MTLVYVGLVLAYGWHSHTKSALNLFLKLGRSLSPHVDKATIKRPCHTLQNLICKSWYDNLYLKACSFRMRMPVGL